MAIQMGGGEMQDTSANYKLTKFEKVSVSYLENGSICIMAVYRYVYTTGEPHCKLCNVFQISCVAVNTKDKGPGTKGICEGTNEPEVNNIDLLPWRYGNILSLRFVW